LAILAGASSYEAVIVALAVVFIICAVGWQRVRTFTGCRATRGRLIKQKPASIRLIRRLLI